MGRAKRGCLSIWAKLTDQYGLKVILIRHFVAVVVVVDENSVMSST